MGCKMLKKDWQRQLCEIACDQIKADSESQLFMKELKQLGKAALKKAKEMGVPMSDSELSNGATMEATTTLHVRNAPCTTGAILTTISAGTQVKYLGETKNGCGYDWRKVRIYLLILCLTKNHFDKIKILSGFRIIRKRMGCINLFERSHCTTTIIRCCCLCSCICQIKSWRMLFSRT